MGKSNFVKKCFDKILFKNYLATSEDGMGGGVVEWPIYVNIRNPLLLRKCMHTRRIQIIHEGYILTTYNSSILL